MGACKYPPLRPLTDAERRTVADNLGLVYQQASKTAWALVKQHGVSGNPRQLADQYISDLADAGMLGLCVAVQRFRPELGNQLSTYAYPWIKNYIGRAIEAMNETSGQRIRGTLRAHRVMLLSELETKDGASRSREAEDWWDVLDEEELTDSEAADDAEHMAYLLTLMGLVLDRRELAVVRGCVLEGRKLRELAAQIRLSHERIRQIRETALEKLRNTPAVVKALDVQRRRQERLGNGTFRAM